MCTWRAGGGHDKKFENHCSTRPKAISLSLYTVNKISDMV